MSPASTSERKSADLSNSDDSFVEIYLFACGHGDTILVHLPDRRWVLIDCHLPKSDGTRGRFFDLLKEKNIERLELVFQTHPHYDHFLGMREVLSYFLDEGRSIGKYVDGGQNVDEILSCMGVERKEFGRLLESLGEWDEQGKLDWRELDAERPPLYTDRVAFIPIAPDPKKKRRDVRKAFRKSGQIVTRQDANAISLVLVLAVSDGGAGFNVLLAADADRQGVERGLEIWKQHTEEAGIHGDFMVIKIPHHGSLDSHHEPLCELGSSEKAAAVSAGTRHVLPDREVLGAYLDSGWKVLTTSVRKVTVEADRPGDLHFGHSRLATSYQRTIRLHWTENGDFHAGPDDALVAQSDLPLYETAGS